jgi:hypothetical protein
MTMARKLLCALNEFVMATQDRCFIGIIDQSQFADDWYLEKCLGRIDVLSRRYIFKTRYAFNIQTIELLEVSGYPMLIDKQCSIYIKLPNAVIRVLNPLQISLDIHYPTDMRVKRNEAHKTV